MDMSIPDEPSIDWANLPVDEALQLLGPEWVTIDDAVAILGQSKSKVDRRRGDEPGPDGPLESLRVRGRRVLVRIPSEELEDPSRMPPCLREADPGSRGGVGRRASAYR